MYWASKHMKVAWMIAWRTRLRLWSLESKAGQSKNLGIIPFLPLWLKTHNSNHFTLALHLTKSIPILQSYEQRASGYVYIIWLPCTQMLSLSTKQSKMRYSFRLTKITPSEYQRSQSLWCRVYILVQHNSVSRYCYFPPLKYQVNQMCRCRICSVKILETQGSLNQDSLQGGTHIL